MYGRHVLSSQLTPQPHPLPLACGFSVTLKLLPISSVAKSIVDPLRRVKETASTSILEGAIVGWENKLGQGNVR